MYGKMLNLICLQLLCHVSENQALFTVYQYLQYVSLLDIFIFVSLMFPPRAPSIRLLISRQKGRLISSNFSFREGSTEKNTEGVENSNSLLRLRHA